MPIYEYVCTGCGHELEVFQKLSDAPQKKCPNCGKNKLQKVISSTSFQLKGQGWYVTDFRDKGKKADSTKTSESEPKANDAEKTTAESKSTTTESKETATKTEKDSKKTES